MRGLILKKETVLLFAKKDGFFLYLAQNGLFRIFDRHTKLKRTQPEKIISERKLRVKEFAAKFAAGEKDKQKRQPRVSGCP